MKNEISPLIQDAEKELIFMLNKNKYTLKWSAGLAKDIPYILINFFLDYIKIQWSTPDILIRVFFFNDVVKIRIMMQIMFMCKIL